MKRVAKQRRFGPGEFSGLARMCVEIILKGESVFDFLRGRGVEDPQTEWYDIRRWIKSNAPELYAQIPTALKLELPVQRVNPNYKPPTEKAAVPNKLGGTSTIKLYGEAKEPEKAPEKTEETEMPAEETKRRPGRPPRAKDEEEPIQEKKARKVPQKAKAKVQVNSVKGRDLNYVLANENVIAISNATCRLQLTTDEIRNMLSELPEVLKLFET